MGQKVGRGENSGKRMGVEGGGRWVGADPDILWEVSSNKLPEKNV